MRRLPACLLAAAALALAGAAPAEEGWRELRGAWSATGERHTLPAEEGRTAAIVRISGSLVLDRGEGLSPGFRAEAIGFDDGSRISVGRAVWTDEAGDRIFSELHGETLESGRRITGTLTGGTGRYRGVEGEYTLSWQYVVKVEDGTLQGRTTDLQGRFRLKPAPR